MPIFDIKCKDCSAVLGTVDCADEPRPFCHCAVCAEVQARLRAAQRAAAQTPPPQEGNT